MIRSLRCSFNYDFAAEKKFQLSHKKMSLKRCFHFRKFLFYFIIIFLLLVLCLSLEISCGIKDEPFTCSGYVAETEKKNYSHKFYVSFSKKPKKKKRNKNIFFNHGEAKKCKTFSFYFAPCWPLIFVKFISFLLKGPMCIQLRILVSNLFHN